MTAGEILAPLEKAIKDSLASAKPVLGSFVTLTKDHAGYIGRVEAVLPSAEHGLIFLVMVLSKKDGTMLNSATWTRQFRPRSDFEWGVKHE